MGRVNKTIGGVFVDIVGSASHISKYDEFINSGKNLKSSKSLKAITASYKKLIDSQKDQYRVLADLEQLILQKRVRENLNPKDIKLSMLREYIYARVSFYRTNTSTKDIRVLVGFSDAYGKTLKDISKNKIFQEHAAIKLQDAMDFEIAENERLLDEVKNKFGRIK
jgi:hypothetical protein